MLEFQDGAFFLGALAAVVSFVLLKRRGFAGLPRMALSGLVGLGAALLGPPVLTSLDETRRSAGLPQIPGDTVLFGVFVAVAAYFTVNTETNPRRLPRWSASVLGLVIAVGVPPVLHFATGSYSDLSLRTDVTRCLSQSDAQSVTNVCDFEIHVGLCLPDERNPSPCLQTQPLLPGVVGQFDPQGTARSSLPANPNGNTLVACEATATPSRTLRVGGRGHRGVCLPGRARSGT